MTISTANIDIVRQSQIHGTAAGEDIPVQITI